MRSRRLGGVLGGRKGWWQDNERSDGIIARGRGRDGGKSTNNFIYFWAEETRHFGDVLADPWVCNDDGDGGISTWGSRLTSELQTKERWRWVQM